MNKGFAKAVEFLQRPKLQGLPVGRYEIDRERVYAMVPKDFWIKKEGGRLTISFFKLS
jgi:beta-galactosidase beta subunit